MLKGVVVVDGTVDVIKTVCVMTLVLVLVEIAVTSDDAVELIVDTLANNAVVNAPMVTVIVCIIVPCAEIVVVTSDDTVI